MVVHGTEFGMPAPREAWRAGARDVELADAMARRLRGDHDHVVALRRRDAAEVDVQSVREQHGRARLEIRGDVGVPDLLLQVIWNEEGDDLRALDRLGDRADLEPCLLCGDA